MHRLSIIIPVLNESDILPASLQPLRLLQARGVEVIMVDGGSEDDSCQLIRDAGLTLLVSQRGRAKQMNAGAQQATGDVLLFLHADTQLPPQVDAIIRQQWIGAHELASRQIPRRYQNWHSNPTSNTEHTSSDLPINPPLKLWGRFSVRISGTAWMFGVISFFMNLRSRLTGIATGDHALFMTRAAFDAVGGFPDQPLMEDVALCVQLKTLSAPICLSEYVVTSGRRWLKHGIWSTIFLMWRLRWRYWRGACPHQLAKEYQ